MALLLCWLAVNRKCSMPWKNTHHRWEIQSSCSLWILHHQPTKPNRKWKVRRPCGRKSTPIRNSTSKIFVLTNASETLYYFFCRRKWVWTQLLLTIPTCHSCYFSITYFVIIVIFLCTMYLIIMFVHFCIFL